MTPRRSFRVARAERGAARPVGDQAGVGRFEIGEGYDGSIILGALDWVEHSLDSLPHVQRRLRRNESGLCADARATRSIDFSSCVGTIGGGRPSPYLRRRRRE